MEDKISKNAKTVIRLSNAGYILGCGMLYVIAFWIILGAIWSIIHEVFYTGDFTIYNLLDEVALVVFSIALVDVAKYLLIAEVLEGQSFQQPPREARQTLTKFTIIIATALSLEGLVLTIEVAKTDVTKILYPVTLLITGTFMVIGLGIYQKFNASAEDNFDLKP